MSCIITFFVESGHYLVELNTTVTVVHLVAELKICC